SVEWSPNKTAVMLRIDDDIYVASVNGTVYDITAEVDNSPNIDWINGALPANFVSLNLPEPIAEGEVTPEATESLIDTRVFSVGDLLSVSTGLLDIYDE